MTGRWSTWPAPAKLNLFLHVNARRPDGYHELQTLFQLLDHGDEVHLRVRGDGRIERLGGPAQIAPEDDLAVRAARALAAHAGAASGEVPGADIRIDKRIPMGGGLGGGSSDAASTLLGLDRLWGLDLGVETLAAIGLGLGADVPVFVHGRSAWGEGVGERLAPVRIEPAWYLVLTPPVHVATAAVFGDPALTRDTPRLKMADFLREGVSGECGRLSARDVLQRTANDCEPVVRRLHPEVGEALDRLGRDAPARMTGTGASVFALVGDEDEAGRLLAARPQGWSGFVARGLDAAPGPGGADASR